MGRSRRVALGAEQVFGALRHLTADLVSRHSGTRRRLDLDAFEALSDTLTIVRPSPRFGAFRFEFFGATVSEIAPLGELTHVAFHDLLDQPFYRSCLNGYRHVFRTGLPHATRDHPLPDRGAAAYFTRLVVPVFTGNRLDLLLGATLPHDEPLAGSRAARG